MGIELLTVADAAERLGVSQARVHQLLRSDDLDGPQLSPGRLRHLPSSGRVTTDSLDRLIARRAGNTTARREPVAQQRRAVDVAVADGTQMRSALAAAQGLKVELDAARSALTAERDRTRRVLGVAAELLALLQSATDGADDVDMVAGAYSDALTQFLAPTDARDLDTDRQ